MFNFKFNSSTKIIATVVAFSIVAVLGFFTAQHLFPSKSVIDVLDEQIGVLRADLFNAQGITNKEVYENPKIEEAITKEAVSFLEMQIVVTQRDKVNAFFKEKGRLPTDEELPNVLVITEQDKTNMKEAYKKDFNENWDKFGNKIVDNIINGKKEAEEEVRELPKELPPESENKNLEKTEDKVSKLPKIPSSNFINSNWILFPKGGEGNDLLRTKTYTEKPVLGVKIHTEKGSISSIVERDRNKTGDAYASYHIGIDDKGVIHFLRPLAFVINKEDKTSEDSNLIHIVASNSTDSFSAEQQEKIVRQIYILSKIYNFDVSAIKSSNDRVDIEEHIALAKKLKASLESVKDPFNLPAWDNVSYDKEKVARVLDKLYGGTYAEGKEQVTINKAEEFGLSPFRFASVAWHETKYNVAYDTMRGADMNFSVHHNYTGIASSPIQEGVINEVAIYKDKITKEGKMSLGADQSIWDFYRLMKNDVSYLQYYKRDSFWDIMAGNGNGKSGYCPSSVVNAGSSWAQGVSWMWGNLILEYTLGQ